MAVKPEEESLAYRIGSGFRNVTSAVDNFYKDAAANRVAKQVERKQAAESVAKQNRAAFSKDINNFVAGYQGAPAATPGAIPISKPQRTATKPVTTVTPPTLSANIPAIARPAAPALAAQPDSASPSSLAPKAGDPNTFTGANGVVRVLNQDGTLTGRGSNPQGSLQIMQSAAPAPAPTAPTVAAPAAPALASGGAPPAPQTSPFRYDPNSYMVTETLRRFDHANSRGGKMTKTAREGRNALLQSLVGGSIQGQNQQAAIGAQGANQLAAVTQQGAAQVQANRERSQAALQAAQIGADAQVEAATAPRPIAPQLVTGQDGRAQVFTGAPELQPLVTADGQPFTPQQQAQQVDPRVQAAQIRAQSELLQSLIPPGATPEQVQQAQQQVLSMMQSAAGGGVPQIPAEAIADLRKNPKSAAQFDATFGAGASARYLNQ